MIETAAIIAFIIQYGYAGVFVGGIFGGEVLLLVVGFMAKLGYFNLIYVILVVTLGVVLWDMGWYTLGRKGGKNAMKLVNYFLTKKEEVDKVKVAFKRHQGKLIVFARFVYGIRAVIFTLAGVLRMRFLYFMFYNLIGTLIWAVILTLLGYFFGGSFEILQDYVQNSFLLIFILVIAAVLILLLMTFLKRNIYKKLLKYEK